MLGSWSVGRRLESALRKHRKCYVYTDINSAFMPNEMEYAKQVKPPSQNADVKESSWSVQFLRQESTC